MSFVNIWILFFLVPIASYLYINTPKVTSTKLRWISLILMIIALSRPILDSKISNQEVPIQSIIIAIDLSRSMKADDIYPNRLEASKSTIHQLLKLNIDDQISLIGFTSNALMLSPLTTDHNLISIALDSIRDDYILTHATNLHKLIEKVSQFPKTNKSLIIFSDGGDSTITQDTISLANQNKIKILSIMMATIEGASIKTTDNQLLKNQKGDIVVSRLNQSFKALAYSTGGEAISFNSSQKVVKKINNWIENIGQKEFLAQQKIKSYYDLYYIFLCIALILILLSSTTLFLKIVLLIAILSSSLSANIIDNYYLDRAYSNFLSKDYNLSLKQLKKINNISLQSQLVLANTYYKLKSYKKAKNILLFVKTRDPNIKYKIYHNLGNIQTELGYYEKAKNSYIKALQLKYNKDTIYNLELVMWLKNKHNSKIGATNPNALTPSNNPQSNSKTKNSDKKTDSNSDGGGGKSKTKISKIDTKTNQKLSKRVLSSKAYDLINKGYIYEKTPW